MSDLKALYESAGGHAELGYGRLVLHAERHGFQVTKQTLSDWFLKRPPQQQRHVEYVMRVLIPYLEDRASIRSPVHLGVSEGAWGRRLSAAQAVSKDAQGGRGSRIGAASRGRLLGGPSRALLDVVPREFVGRETEAADLAAFVKAPDGAPDYVWWQAGHWAGKTALMAWFVVRELPAGVDVAHYVVSGRLGTDRRDDFVRAVAKQLAAAVGGRLPAVDRDKQDLGPLYAAAAGACEGRDRRLVLIVDGLDEDADVGPKDSGIAGLLPKVPPNGMRIIVAGRPNPRLPEGLVSDHPLRDPAIVRRLTSSPAARHTRDTATAELRLLLDDRGIGHRLLGLLVAARGGLTGADLGELLGIEPHVVHDRLRTVAGRSFTPTRTGLLPLDVRAELEAEAARQTFVLAHDTLLVTARAELGEPFIKERALDLHRWARKYRAEGWPENTPNYLLTGYARLLRDSGEVERLTALILDPQRQLRLVQRSGPDVALAELDMIAPSVTDPWPELGRATAAAAAASREMLSPHVRPLPAPVAQTIARLGDTPRARALAGASGSAVDKASNLAGVARVLLAMGDEQAAATARDAGEWARAALREADRLGHATDEAEAAAVEAALVLLEASRVPASPRAQDATASVRRSAAAYDRPASEFPGVRSRYEDGLTLLHSTKGTSSARNEAWARAALLLAPDRPEEAAELLDELEEQAETLAAEDPAEGAAAAGAIQLWQTVASTAPDRTDRLHHRVLAHATEVWEACPALEKVAVVAAAASMVAGSRPEQAERLVASACRYIEHVLRANAAPLSTTDAFHVEFGFRHTLTVFSQALADVGTSPEEADRVLELGQGALPPEPPDRPGRPSLGEDEDRALAEATGIAGHALRLAEQGADNEAEHQLAQALALLPVVGSAEGRSPVWLPDLAAAVVRSGRSTEVASLLGLVRDPADRVRVHAAMALAGRGSPQSAEARRHARAASRAAAEPSASDANWPYAAQALASAGEVESALDLIARHGKPESADRRAAWRKTDRTVRIAVAAELAEFAPEAAGELILPLLKRLVASLRTPRSQGLLTSLAELLPATVHLPPEHRTSFDAIMEEAREQASRSSPHSWVPEEVLVHAFLRIESGEVPGRQLDWLTGDMSNRGTRHFPTAALALLHAALHDTATAQRVAALPAAPHQRAAALSAVASHLARVLSPPCPVPDPIGTDFFTRTIQHLALKATSTIPPANAAAMEPLHQALTTPGWHFALPALARLAPEAVAAVCDITVVHLRVPPNLLIR
ncbi:hypothetical protein ACWCWD_17055 [Streptomyces sp. NPDC001493]